jgi:hypothetical protein
LRPKIDDEESESESKLGRRIDDPQNRPKRSNSEEPRDHLEKSGLFMSLLESSED